MGLNQKLRLREAMNKSPVKIVMFIWVIGLIAIYHPCMGGSKPFKIGLDCLANRITLDMGQHLKQYMAVPDFTDLDGRVSELGMFISEELLTRLHNTQKVKVVERRLLIKVIEEHPLGLTGLIDPKSVKRLGKMGGRFPLYRDYYRSSLHV